MRPILAFLALFSGIALLLEIVLTFDLRIGLALGAFGAVAAVAFMLRRADPFDRRWIVRSLGYGAVAGLVATLAYDATRTILTMLDPSPYRPFEAIKKFGELLLGSGASEDSRLLAGALFHGLNGSTFGIAYTMLFARNGAVSWRRALLLGIGWGLFLELFQIVLYPDWLNIKYFNEFVSISALGHLVYGATLAGLSVGLLRRAARPDGAVYQGAELADDEGDPRGMGGPGDG